MTPGKLDIMAQIVFKHGAVAKTGQHIVGGMKSKKTFLYICMLSPRMAKFMLTIFSNFDVYTLQCYVHFMVTMLCLYMFVYICSQCYNASNVGFTGF